MIYYITPIVFFCIIGTGECNSQNASDHKELDPVNTPIQCLLDGTVYATQYVVEHSVRKFEYRIVCKFAEKV